MIPSTLHIVRWAEIFENADTRKRERLKSFHAPSGLESRGYLALVSRFPQDRAMMAFGVFQALCQLSATLGRSVRGSFKNSDGTPMDLQQLSVLLRIEICHLSAALEILSDQRVRWVSWGSSADNLPTICRSSPSFVQGEGEGEGEGKQAMRVREESDPLPESPPEKAKPRPAEIPTLAEVLKYARSAPVPISVECATAFHDTQEADGWINRYGHSIADWRAALRRYASRWIANEPRAMQTQASAPLKKLEWEK
jgi:hypothetical protein